MRRWAIGIPAVVPWTVLTFRETPVELVFAWGIVNTDPIHVVSTFAYAFEHTMGLPDRLLAWPIAALLYAAAGGSALSGALVGREDERLTAGLLFLSGASCLAFTLGVGARNPSVTAAVPVGTLALWAIAWPIAAGSIR